MEATPRKATGIKRFALCYDGGSIGQEPDEHGVMQEPKNDEHFRRACEPVIEQFQQLTKAMIGITVEVDYFFRSKKDSINKHPSSWAGMAAETQKRQDEEYDAIGFLMGTDTAASAMGAVALLAHENNSLRIPIDFTAAQLPIYRFDGDGRFNLMCLLKTLVVACQRNIADVMFNFSYEIFKAVRVQKCSPDDFDGFMSPSLPTIGKFHAYKYGVDLDTRFLRTADKRMQSGRMDLSIGFDSSGVHMLDLQPGYQAQQIRKLIDDQNPKVIILRTDGDHNVSNEEDDFNLIPVIANATKNGVTVLLTTKYPTKSPVMGGRTAMEDSSNHATYGPGEEALNAGAIACGDITNPTIWAKVLRGRAKKILDWKQYMKMNIADEVSEYAG